MKEITEVPRLPFRDKCSHKGNYSKVLIIAGSAGMMGAACLAASSCLRSGAGLVTLGTPVSMLSVAATKLTCAMSQPFPETREGTFAADAVQSILETAKSADVIALGPGLSQHPQTQSMVQGLLPRLDKPAVIDADGLNAVATCPNILAERSAATVITPHPGEFSRLSGYSIEELKQSGLKIAGEFATKHKCIVVLKLAPAIVTDGNRYYTNTTGNPGMATGGSGDVLTGVVAALMTQLPPFLAAQLAMYVHGYAGDIACEKYGEVGMIASDILESLPKAFLTM